MVSGNGSNHQSTKNLLYQNRSIKYQQTENWGTIIKGHDLLRPEEKRIVEMHESSSLIFDSENWCVPMLRFASERDYLRDASRVDVH